MSSIENDSRYKRTWGTGGTEGENDADGSKVVSKQPSGVRNGQAAQVNAAGPSGPYIQRYCPGYFILLKVLNFLVLPKLLQSL